MKPRDAALGIVIGLALSVARQSARAEDSRTVRVVPKTTNAILANPGMGWQTFQQSALQDRQLPDWIPSTVYYARWGWVGCSSGDHG